MLFFKFKPRTSKAIFYIVLAFLLYWTVFLFFTQILSKLLELFVYKILNGVFGGVLTKKGVYLKFSKNKLFWILFDQNTCFVKIRPKTMITMNLSLEQKSLEYFIFDYYNNLLREHFLGMAGWPFLNREHSEAYFYKI